MKITFLGAGSWASALGKLLAEDENNAVTFYTRRSQQAAEIAGKGTNQRYLPNMHFPRPVFATTSLKEALREAELVVQAVPTQSIRGVLEQACEWIPEHIPIVNVSKGVEQGTHLRISEIVEELCPNHPYAVLSGPSHAEEVYQSQPTTVVVASEDEELARTLQELFMRPYFRVYTGTDVLGVEIGGAVKNILALGIGIADGLRYGDNAKAALITRGMHEMIRFGEAVGAKAQTLNGLAGFGDLYVTATSLHSRNRNAGELIGRGYSLRETELAIGQAIEGVKTCQAVCEWAQKHKVEMPITEALSEVLFQNAPVADTVKALMRREKKEEFDGRGR